jgi:cytochrome c556
MLRKAGMMFAGTLGLVFVLGSAAAEEEKTPPIKTIMKTFSGKNGVCAKCAAAGKAANWEDAQKYAKSLTACGVNIGKNKCPRGDADSWEKLTKKFADQTAAIEKAAQAKDAEALSTAVGAFTKSCGACHSVHKGKKKQ